VQLLVDNRSDSIKMHGATIRIIPFTVNCRDVILTFFSQSFVAAVYVVTVVLYLYVMTVVSDKNAGGKLTNLIIVYKEILEKFI